MPVPLRPGTWKKYDEYSVVVDSRTLAYFIAFFGWYSISPLLEEIEKENAITTHEAFDSDITAVAGSVMAQFIIGPLCDNFGARKTFAVSLFFGCIPVFLSGLVNTAVELSVMRFFIGWLGATYVCNQAWNSQMFSRDIVGFVNALSAGWGNAGGAVAYLVITGLWKILDLLVSTELAWRLCCILPGMMILICSFCIHCYGDDAPKGNFDELVANGVMLRKTREIFPSEVYFNLNTWILAFQFGCSFGIELTLLNVLPLYAEHEFGVDRTDGNLIAALFGLLNIVSRGLGGWLSDRCYKRPDGSFSGMRGRLGCLFFSLLAESVGIIIFSRMGSFSGAMVSLLSFSFAVHMSEGTIFSVVPYVAPSLVGTVTGLVAAGGSFGAIIWSIIIRFGPSEYEEVFFILGFIVLAGACMCLAIIIPGHNSILFEHISLDEEA